MDMNTTIINRETLNGTMWSLVADQYGVSLYRGNQYSGYWFRTIEEAHAHLDAIDERVSKPVQFSHSTVPANYYDDTTRYYGD